MPCNFTLFQGLKSLATSLYFRESNHWQHHLFSGIEIPGNNIGRAYGTLFVRWTNLCRFCKVI